MEKSGASARTVWTFVLSVVKLESQCQTGSLPRLLERFLVVITLAWLVSLYIYANNKLHYYFIAN